MSGTRRSKLNSLPLLLRHALLRAEERDGGCNGTISTIVRRGDRSMRDDHSRSCCAVMPRVLYAKSLRPWRRQPTSMYEQVRACM
jgi:hypothetical protein